MPGQTPSTSAQLHLWQALANFRYHLRRFTHFSEEAACDHGLRPQQHQLLLQIAGCPPAASPTVAYAAERLGLRHNSAVELVDRCSSAGLLSRHPDPHDGRSVLLRITVKGNRLLNRLSEFHARELNEMAPQLVRSLELVGGFVAVSAPGLETVGQ